MGGGEEGEGEEADARMYMYVGVLSLLVAESQYTCMEFSTIFKDYLRNNSLLHISSTPFCSSYYLFVVHYFIVSDSSDYRNFHHTK